MSPDPQKTLAQASTLDGPFGTVLKTPKDAPTTDVPAANKDEAPATNSVLLNVYDKKTVVYRNIKPQDGERNL